MALVGNTVKLKAEFINYDGSLYDPEEITLKIYDNVRRQVGTTINIGASHKKSVGVYEYNFLVPEGFGNLTFEFIGTLEGNPSIGRGTIVRTWT